MSRICWAFLRILIQLLRHLTARTPSSLVELRKPPQRTRPRCRKPPSLRGPAICDPLPSRGPAPLVLLALNSSRPSTLWWLRLPSPTDLLRRHLDDGIRTAPGGIQPEGRIPSPRILYAPSVSPPGDPISSHSQSIYSWWTPLS